MPEGEWAADFPPLDAIMLYDRCRCAVRVANVERAQLLVESTSRPALQEFLRVWSHYLPYLANEARVRWQLEVDPLEI